MSQTATSQGELEPTTSPDSTDERLSLPSYDLAYRRFLDDAYEGFKEDHEFLGGIESVRDRHAGPIRNVREGKLLDQPMVSLSAGMPVERAAIRSTDVEAHTAVIHAFAEEMIGEQLRQFFANLGEMCDAAGTTVPNVGQGAPTLEQFRDLLQRMELSFDEEGRVQQQLVVHPSQEEKARALWASVQNDPECLRIVLEKRAKWMELRAARSHRTLPR